MDEFTGLMACLGVGIAVCVVICLLLAGPIYLINSCACSAKADQLGLEHDFGFFKGCFVREKNGQWIDYNNYRVVLPHE